VGVKSTGGALVGAAVLVDVGGTRPIRGILQFASRSAIRTNEIINGIMFRFTLAVEIIIPP
jgi:hypothetical protein